MNRPDLTSLTDEDLLLLCSQGLLNRARRELTRYGDAAELITDPSGGSELCWPDGVTCWFAAGSSLPAGACSCKAQGVCRHLLRSILYMRQHLSAEQTTEESSEDCLQWEEARLVAAAGGQAIRRARRLLSQATADAKRRQVRFADSGAVVRWPLGGGWGSALCSCRRMDCPHALAALLALRGYRPTTGEPAKSTESLRRRVRELCVRAIRRGLESLGPDWLTTCQVTALRARRGGRRDLARALLALAEQVAQDQQGTSRFDPLTYRTLLATAWAAAAVERSAQRPDAAERPVDRLLCVGALIWRRRLEATWGATVFWQSPENGEILRSTVGSQDRPRPQRLRVMGWLTLAGCLGRWVHLSQARLSGHVLRQTKDSSARLLDERVDWPAVLGGVAIRRWGELAEQLLDRFPSLLRGQPPVVRWLSPSAWQRPWFDPAEQRLFWPVTDEIENELTLELGYRRRLTPAFQIIEESADAPRPGYVLGQINVRAGRLVARPISFVTTAGPQSTFWCVDAPPSALLVRPAAESVD